MTASQLRALNNHEHSTVIARTTSPTDPFHQPVATAARPTKFRIHWRWAGPWAFLTCFALFEVIKHGYVNGTALDATVLTLTAVGFFVAPDLTFLIGAGDEVEQGSISTRAVPFYNAAHRMLIALAFTTVIGIGLAPLAPVPLALFIGGLSWMAHIALDRTTGYGLRNQDGSRDRS
ncbi:MAG: DUF4260 family protein [Acidimicrobiales bacterium]